MWSTIEHLPPDLLGVQVFSFLTLESLVKMDSAVSEKRHRSILEIAFKFATVSTIKTTPRDCGKKAWKWCTLRKVAISKLEFDELNEGEADLFSGVLSLVNTTGTVTWNCVVGGLASNSTYKIINGSRGNVERINSF
jgi:hypothetical protein